MHQALYRKYRPTTFNDVSGQEHITSVLKYEIENNRTSHAYLFCGSRGTGKTTCAKILAKAVNCLSPVNGSPCGKCAACLEIASGISTDIVEMDAASNNGVDYIREIRDDIVYTPATLKKRVYIIDEVHMLSASAFNALLKTLEEPPSHAIFILATTELHKLPVTVISRCQRFDFRRLTVSDISARLAYIAKCENITLSEEAAAVIAKQAQGGMRDAISLLELCGGGGNDITIEKAREILGMSGYDRMKRTVDAITSHDIPTLLKIVAEVYSSSQDISVFWQELMSFYRDMLVCKYSSDAREYLDLSQTELATLKQSAENINLKTIMYHNEIIDQTQQTITRLPNIKRTAVEFALVKMSEPKLEATPAALLSRIGELEDKLALMSAGIPVSSKPSEASVQQDDNEITQLEVSAQTADKALSGESGDLLPVLDIDSVLERLAELNVSLCSFLRDCTAYISSDKRTVIIKSTNAFGITMLSSEASQRSLAEAFVLAKVTETLPKIKLEAQEKARASRQDKLADIL